MSNREDLAIVLNDGLSDLCNACPVPVRLVTLDELGENPMVPITRAAAPGGMGALVYDMGRHEAGGHPRAVPVAVILPFDQFARLMPRPTEGG